MKKLTLAKAKARIKKSNDFKEFTHIDDDAAAFLGAQEIDPPYLDLDGLVTISPSAVASLGALKGVMVGMPGLVELTDEAAEAMAPFKSVFYFLPDVATKALAKARKRLKTKKG